HIRTINSIGFFFLWTSAFGNNASFPEAAMQTAHNLSTAIRGRATYGLVSPPAGKRIVQSMAEVVRIDGGAEAPATPSLPQNIEAEAALLGALMIDNRLLEERQPLLKPHP